MAFVSPRGTLGRRGFLLAYAAQSLAVMGVIATLVLLDDADPGSAASPLQLALFAAYALLTTVGYVIGARRMRDQGLPGWCTLVGLVPLVGSIIWLLLVTRRSARR